MISGGLFIVIIILGFFGWKKQMDVVVLWLSCDCYSGKSEEDDGGVIYGIGESMQEIIERLWKEYARVLPSQCGYGCSSSDCPPTLEIRIPAENITSTNRKVRFCRY